MITPVQRPSVPGLSFGRRALFASAAGLLLGSGALAQSVRVFNENLEAAPPASLTLAAGQNSPRLGGGVFSASSGGGRLMLSQGPGLGKHGGGGVQLNVVEPAEKYAIVTCAVDTLSSVTPAALQMRDLVGAFVSFDLSAPVGRMVDVYIEFAPNGPDNQQFWANNAPYLNRLVLGRLRGEGDFRTNRYVLNERAMPTMQKFIDYVRSTDSPEFRLRLKWAIADASSWKPDSVLRIDNVTIELP